MRIAVLADTHIADGSSVRLPERAWEVVRSADVVLHAGDVTGAALLAELRGVRPTYAVLGNNDGVLRGLLPETLELELDGVSIAMVHDSASRLGRENRLHRRFPNARVVVFGHSHIPWNAAGIDGQLLFNPGSATQRRSQPHRTMGVLHVDAGEVRAEVVEL
jgi:putative phosphoesterase